MKKIWIAVILLVCLLAGSGIYVNTLKKSVNKMNAAIAEAYACVDGTYAEIPKKLAEIDGELKKKESLLCVFIDQKLIVEVKDELLIAKELYNQHNSGELKVSLIRLYEKINSLKDTEEFNLKKIL